MVEMCRFQSLYYKFLGNLPLLHAIAMHAVYHALGCTGMHKSWKCHAPQAKSDAKTLIFWEIIKIWAVN